MWLAGLCAHYGGRNCDLVDSEIMSKELGRRQSGPLYYITCPGVSFDPGEM